MIFLSAEIDIYELPTWYEYVWTGGTPKFTGES